MNHCRSFILIARYNPLVVRDLFTTIRSKLIERPAQIISTVSFNVCPFSGLIYKMGLKEMHQTRANNA